MVFNSRFSILKRSTTLSRLITLRVIAYFPFRINLRQVDYGNSTSCTIEWPEGGLIRADKAFICYAFTLAFAVPVICISIFYSLVVIRIRTKGPSGRSANRRQSGRRVTRMVLAVITVYVVCWLPYWVFQVSRPPTSLSLYAASSVSYELHA